MPKRVAIIGSGYIAVEFAGIFAGLGAQVDLVYRQPLPLRGFDMDLRESLAEALGAQGIALHPGCLPTKLEADGDERVLTLATDRRCAPTWCSSPPAARRRPGASGSTRSAWRLNDDRRGAGRSAPAHHAAAHLCHGRRHRPAEPDAGRDRRGPRAGRLRCSASNPRGDLAAQCADGGVLHAADRDLRADRGAGGASTARSMSMSASSRRCATRCPAARARAC